MSNIDDALDDLFLDFILKLRNSNIPALRLAECRAYSTKIDSNVFFVLMDILNIIVDDTKNIKIMSEFADFIITTFTKDNIDVKRYGTLCRLSVANHYKKEIILEIPFDHPILRDIMIETMLTNNEKIPSHYSYIDQYLLDNYPKIC